MRGDVIYEAKDLKKWFPAEDSFWKRSKRFVKAVDGVSLKIHQGETLGIVGESGCGKSTLIRLMMGLLPVTDGQIFFEGQNISAMNSQDKKILRRQIQIVFQDPYAALNPRQKAGDMILEAIDLGNEILMFSERQKEVNRLLDMVGLPQDAADKFPHEFSGGQRQRLCIARALAVKPKLLMCDECVSALDVSIQAQIINLLMKLQKEMGLTIVFVSHDLRVIRHIADRVAVMYLGKIVEFADSEALFTTPKHPYTKALLSTIPVADPNAVRKPIVLKGDIPSPIHVPSGCPFHTRCWMSKEQCAHVACSLCECNARHLTACPFYHEIES